MVGQLMPFLWLMMLCLLSSCVPPVYDGTTYGIDEFIQDSRFIAAGKNAILLFEDSPDSVVAEVNLYDRENLVIEGDELNIALYCPKRHDRMKMLSLINQRVGFRTCDGKICLPQLSPIEVTGLTLEEIKQRIQALYREQIEDVQIFVGFKKQKERQVQVLGAGASMISIDARTRLAEVLARAQLPSGANLFKSEIVRDGQKLPIDFYRLINEGDSSQNIVVQSGDQIYIAKSDEVTVMTTGEVKSQVIAIPYGFISLLEVLGIANGIPYTADKTSIYVIRGELRQPKIYCLNWNDLLQNPHSSLLLMSGDVVYLTEAPITQWNRFITQLDISLTCFNSGRSVYSIFD
jgi:polysaccharide export outer membrane protein